MIIKKRLDQPQVIGYFVDANRSRRNLRSISKVKSKKCFCIVPPSFTRAMNSKPMQVLLLHVFFQFIPLLSLLFAMLVDGRMPSRLHWNVTYTVRSFGICIEALDRLYLNTMILRHVTTRSRVHPSNRTQPEPSQGGAAVVRRDYSWTLARLTAQLGRTDASNSKRYSVEFDSI